MARAPMACLTSSSLSPSLRRWAARKGGRLPVHCRRAPGNRSAECHRPRLLAAGCELEAGPWSGRARPSAPGTTVGGPRKAYVHWIRRFIFFHDKLHPAHMGPAEVTAFLTSLAVRDKVAASTQNQALSALLFLYREVLDVDLPWLEDVVRAKRRSTHPWS